MFIRHHTPKRKSPLRPPVGRGSISQFSYIKMISPEPITVNKIVPIQEALIPTKVDSSKVAITDPTPVVIPTRERSETGEPALSEAEGNPLFASSESAAGAPSLPRSHTRNLHRTQAVRACPERSRRGGDFDFRVPRPVTNLKLTRLRLPHAPDHRVRQTFRHRHVALIKIERRRREHHQQPHRIPLIANRRSQYRACLLYTSRCV